MGGAKNRPDSSVRALGVKPMRRVVRYRRLLFGLAAAAGMLLAAELLIRALGWGLLPIEQLISDVYDPRYQMLPGAPNPFAKVNEFLNSSGFRGRDLSPQPTPGVRRIISVGDSTTFGVGVQDEENYTFRLAAQLRERGLAAEVLNAGIPGTSLWQQRMLIEDRLLARRPDLVLLYTGPSFRMDQDVWREAQQGGLRLKILQRGLAHSRLYRLLRLWLRPPRFQEVINQYFAQPGAMIPHELALSHAREDLAALRDRCREFGARLLITPRLARGPFEAARAEGLHAGDPRWPILLRRQDAAYDLVEMLRELEIPQFQAADDFLEASYGQEMFLDDTHFTPAGHELMARLAAEAICGGAIFPEACH
jgi:lysophospholipase L1-like esterase